MRDLRKADVSAVFSVPHSKEIELMLTIGMLAHPSIGDFREEPGCVAFISHCNARPGGKRARHCGAGFETRTQACVYSRLIARIGYHRNVRGAASLPIHP
jgi:hypothetical protein